MGGDVNKCLWIIASKKGAVSFDFNLVIKTDKKCAFTEFFSDFNDLVHTKFQM